MLVADPVAHPDGFVADLIEASRAYAHRPVLFYNNDGMLLAISRHRTELANYYRFLLPKADLVEDLVDKTRFAGLAAELDLPVPRTVGSSHFCAPEEALAQVSLPCILKPDSRHLGWDGSTLQAEEGGDPQKVLIARTADEFRRLHARVRQLTERFVVQPYIPGGDDCIYSFHGYFNRQGEPLAFFVGRKVRTYPKDNGRSTYLELARDPTVVEMSLAVLRRLNFVGAVKVDLKRDPTTGRYYVLEINPRFTLWSHLGAASGINLPLIAYAEQTDQAVSLQLAYSTGTRWLSFGNDFRAFVRSYRPTGLTTVAWLRSYPSPKVYDVFARDDWLPLLVTICRYIKGLLCRLLRGIRRMARPLDAGTRHASERVEATKLTTK